ncbi:hypothetical protein CAXC1_300005 [Candidatus Xenohaliotis californiensis]|uniref:Uncharacterized protein n=1 Tax=Candidatus Xenohaliotis californiensis TaxID=84677 RepID=A0ABP0ESX9_9RICK|nr:hypothetical protein CAXC1_300005 [Candidatus Xenohaliotis californiensis]
MGSILNNLISKLRHTLVSSNKYSIANAEKKHMNKKFIDSWLSMSAADKIKFINEIEDKNMNLYEKIMGVLKEKIKQGSEHDGQIMKDLQKMAAEINHNKSYITNLREAVKKNVELEKISKKGIQSKQKDVAGKLHKIGQKISAVSENKSLKETGKKNKATKQHENNNKNTLKSNKQKIVTQSNKSSKKTGHNAGYDLAKKEEMNEFKIEKQREINKDLKEGVSQTEHEILQDAQALDHAIKVVLDAAEISAMSRIDLKNSNQVTSANQTPHTTEKQGSKSI